MREDRQFSEPSWLPKLAWVPFCRLVNDYVRAGTLVPTCQLDGKGMVSGEWLEEFHAKIASAFESAELSVQYERIASGPTLPDRAKKLRDVAKALTKAAEEMTGLRGVESWSGQTIPPSLWQYVRQNEHVKLSTSDQRLFGPEMVLNSVVLSIEFFQNAASLAEADANTNEAPVKMEGEDKVVKAGRPPDKFAIDLFSAFMGIWVWATDQEPAVYLERGETIAPVGFCTFFESYFQQAREQSTHRLSNAELTAEKIAWRCRQILAGENGRK